MAQQNNVKGIPDKMIKIKTRKLDNAVIENMHLSKIIATIKSINKYLKHILSS